MRENNDHLIGRGLVGQYLSSVMLNCMVKLTCVVRIKKKTSLNVIMLIRHDILGALSISYKNKWTRMEYKTYKIYMYMVLYLIINFLA